MPDVPSDSSSITSAKWVTFRAFVLGLVGVILICIVSPYNFSVASNTDLVGNALPCGVLLFFFLFVILINSPLRAKKPAWAFTTGELSVALAMMLIGCALPNAGLMRYLPGALVSTYSHSSTNSEVAQLVRQLHLPDWMFPDFATTDPISRGNENVVVDFVGRAPAEADTFVAHFNAVPWRLWIRPALTWGIFFAALYGAVLSMMSVLRHQWAEGERLPFPLASVFLSVVEQPSPGKLFNRLFSSRRFWICFALVFCLHGINALQKFYPKYIPAIPLKFDLTSVMGERPWNFVEWYAKVQTISFTVIGLCYFIRSSTAFSLWFMYVLVQVVRVGYGYQGGDLPDSALWDQRMGAVTSLGIGVVWIGRHHLAMVLRQMVGRSNARNENGRYIPNPLAGWVWIACVAFMIGWLLVAGASLVGAVVIVLCLVLIFVVCAKLVAETGLPFVEATFIPTRGFEMLANQLNIKTTMQSVYFTGLFHVLQQADIRQSSATYAIHAMRTADMGNPDSPAQRRAGGKFVLFLICSLLVAYVVSGASQLYIHYTFDVTVDKSHESLDQNGYGWYWLPKYTSLDTTNNFMPGKNVPTEAHNRLGHILCGGIVTAGLSFLRFRFAGFPIHPAAYMLAFTWAIRQTWFSIFLGWLMKSLIVRFGGSKLFEFTRDIFLAMIIGESVATGFWLLVNLFLAFAGKEFWPVTFIPA